MNDVTDQKIVELIYQQWQNYFASINPSGLAELYTQEAVLFGSKIPAYIGRTAIQSYFENLSQGLYIKAQFTPEYIKRLTSDIISIAGSVTFTRTEQTDLELRFTHILVSRDGRWLIASHHVSPKKTL
jgi:uncharacterized protein (TIGR02246 family)